MLDKVCGPLSNITWNKLNTITTLNPKPILIVPLKMLFHILLKLKATKKTYMTLYNLETGPNKMNVFESESPKTTTQP
jgi:hypothetical protein